MSEEPSQNLEPSAPADAVSAVVGIGASAGGLEAIEGFFLNLPADTGVAFVVVTHQHAGRTSLLPELLRKHVGMPVVEATNGMLVQPNHVYLPRPGCNLALLQGRFQVMDVPSTGKPTMPVDYFFRSLALDQKSKAIGIVLSGTGTDGSLGLTAIQGEGGLTMAQVPASAKYGGMPSSAIATGRVDFALPVEQLALQLVAYLNAPYPPRQEPEPERTADLSDAFQQIFILLRDRTRHDFSLYKKSTSRRRIERRMGIHQLKSYSSYVHYLNENPTELDVLFKELLIGVTSFFRDPEAFVALTTTYLPALLGDKRDDDTVRAWVVGCSTGEEAYSLAICLFACRAQLRRRFRVQVFATDLDSEAIETARKGAYPDGIANDVSLAYLEGYFIHHEGGYQIKKEVRESVVFAVHNVLSDPPFHALDLISCRNLLIYLENEPQKHLISTFHYSLRAAGILLLGTSESLGGAESLFEPLDQKWKLFQRSNASPAANVLPRAPGDWVLRRSQELSGISTALKKNPPADVVAMLDLILLDRHAPPSLIIHENGDILAIRGRTGAFLEPASGRVSTNILTMAREGLQGDLAMAIRQALAQSAEVVHPGVRVKGNGESTVADLVVVQLQQPDALRGKLLVTFRPVRVEGPATRTGESATLTPATTREEELERDLRETKAILQTTIERLETTNEELSSTNEELQSTNEEAQSVNEELETTKEELQSLNEELQTVNAELEAKVNELSRANDDIVNLLNGTEIATLLLDRQCQITRFTSPSRHVVNLIASDVGRPVSDISFNLEYTDLVKDCQEVLATLIPKEREVRSRNGSWFQMRINVYRTTENVIAGVIVTFSDISRLRRAELAEVLLETIHEPFLILEGNMKVVRANRAFCQLFKVSLAEVQGRKLYDLGNGQWDIPQLRTLLEQVLPQDTSVDGFKVDHEFPAIGKRVMLLNARRVEQPPDRYALIFLAFEERTMA